MAIQINSDKAICYKCGTAYGRYKGNFPVSYASLHKGVGYIPVCKSCIDSMYNSYLAQCNDAKSAVRQVCRKLDLYWSDNVFDLVIRKSTTRTMMTQYIAKINTITYAGKSYDDTLSDEGILWDFAHKETNEINEEPKEEPFEKPINDVEVPEEILAFWGTTYDDPGIYDVLEKKFAYYKDSFPKDSKIDLGTERLLRQLCILEATIDRDNAAGKSVEKSVNTYNTLLGSLNLRPVQKKDDNDSSIYNTPMGVWIDRYENKKPIPDDETENGKNYLKKYILAWFGGHVSKMFGIKNANTKLYDEEIAKYRVDRPEFDDDSDDDMMYDILSDVEYDEGSLTPEDGEAIDDEE